LVLTESRADALALLARAAEKSRRSSVPYSREFVRSLINPPGYPVATPPLARLIQGGRGGEARLKLYLLLTMMATRQPFDIRNPPTARTLARTLDLPPATGPRRITSNMRWLATNRYIALTKRQGLTPAIQLLDPRGTGKPLRDPRHPRPYVSIPIGFWSRGWLVQLSPVAIAVMFVLREVLGGYKASRYVLPDRRESYGLSHDTWTRGRHELEEAGLLKVTRVPQGEEYVYNRLRNSYWLNIEQLNDDPVGA
jgi:hypothetical protein